MFEQKTVAITPHSRYISLTSSIRQSESRWPLTATVLRNLLVIPHTMDILVLPRISTRRSPPRSPGTPGTSRSSMSRGATTPMSRGIGTPASRLGTGQVHTYISHIEIILCLILISYSRAPDLFTHIKFSVNGAIRHVPSDKRRQARRNDGLRRSK